MSTSRYETEEVSDLKQEIADYLGMEHGGYRDGSELDTIRAAEHIVSTFVEPFVREATRPRSQMRIVPAGATCPECCVFCASCQQDYPCSTVLALEGDPK